jgi:hypothetical protein
VFRERNCIYLYYRRKIGRAAMPDYTISDLSEG